MTGSSLRVLLIGESATLAHVARPFVLAQQLAESNFEVHFAADRFYQFVYERAHFPTYRINSRSPSDFQDVLERKGVLFDAALLRRYVADDLELFRAVKPDVVIGDLRPSLSVSAPLSRVPYVALTNAYWSPASSKPSLPPMYSSTAHRFRWSRALSNVILSRERHAFEQILPMVFAAQAEGLDTVRAEHGLDPFTDYLSGFTWGDATFFCDVPGVAKVRELQAHQHYIGPLPWSPTIAPPPWLNELTRERPIVYVSLGSSGPHHLLPKIVRALGTLDLSVVISSAGAPLDVELPNNCRIADYLPGEAVLARADVAICNGGSPSTYQALAAGVPVLGIPANMDQLLNMEHAASSGAAISLRSDVLTVSSVSRAVRQLLNDDSYRRRAAMLGQEILSFANMPVAEIIRDLVRSYRAASREEVSRQNA